MAHGFVGLDVTSSTSVFGGGGTLAASFSSAGTEIISWAPAPTTFAVDDQVLKPLAEAVTLCSPGSTGNGSDHADEGSAAPSQVTCRSLDDAGATTIVTFGSFGSIAAMCCSAASMRSCRLSFLACASDSFSSTYAVASLPSISWQTAMSRKFPGAGSSFCEASNLRHASEYFPSLKSRFPSWNNAS